MADIVTLDRGFDNASAENVAKRDVSPLLAMLQPDVAPLITIMSASRQLEASSPVFEWPTDELEPEWDVLAGALAADAVSMVVTNYKYFRKGNLVKIDDEVVLVTANPTTTTVAIKRGIGDDASAVAHDNGSKLFIFSSAEPEGAALSRPQSTLKVVEQNYLQIFETNMQFTRTVLKSSLYTGDEFQTQLKKKMIEHKRKMERASIFGKKAIYRAADSGNDHDLRMTGGYLSMIENDIDAGGEFTEDEMCNVARIACQYGSSERTAFCSPKALQVINGYGREKIQVVDQAKTYGVNMSRFMSAGDSFLLAPHKDLVNEDLTDFSGIAGMMIVLDTKDISLRYLAGSLAILDMDAVKDGKDGKTFVYRSEVGFQMGLGKKHAVVRGITS